MPGQPTLLFEVKYLDNVLECWLSKWLISDHGFNRSVVRCPGNICGCCFRFEFRYLFPRENRVEISSKVNWVFDARNIFKYTLFKHILVKLFVDNRLSLDAKLILCDTENAFPNLLVTFGTKKSFVEKIYRKVQKIGLFLDVLHCFLQGKILNFKRYFVPEYFHKRYR